jgi:PBP1b-binding outer membrane lipoprotein LpoB
MRFNIMKWLFLLLLGALISTGCGQTDTPPTAPPSTAAPTAETVATIPPTTEPPAEAEVETAVEPEQAAPTESLTPSLAEPTDVPPTATAVADSAGQQESSVAEPVVFNGVYENSYFRGAADAPVTMIDYSDFL